MAQSVSTNEYRATFVRGWLTGGVDPADGSVECGAGTSYPIEVTKDQLAKIMYRVKDARFIDGTIGFFVDEELNPFFSIQGTPSAQLVNLLGDDYNSAYYERGYTTNEILEGFNASQFGSSYPIGIETYSDAVTELAMWTSPMQTPTSLRTGFSHSMSMQIDGGLDVSEFYGLFSQNLDPADYFLSSAVDVVFSGEIAYTGASPFDTGGKLYLGVNFDVFAEYFRLALGGDFDDAYAAISTNENALQGYWGAAVETGASLRIKLGSTDEVSCPLYYFSDNLETTAVTDFVIMATAWWPYAKNSPAEPIWDTLTGEKL